MVLEIRPQDSRRLKSILSVLLCFCLPSMQAFQHSPQHHSTMIRSLLHSSRLLMKSPSHPSNGASTIRGSKKSDPLASQTPIKSNAASEFEFIMAPEQLERKIKYSLGTKLDSSPTLVLNADYTPLSHAPLSLWNWRDSLRAVLSGKARVVSEYSGLVIRSVSCSFKLPSVIALNTYYRKPAQIPLMTRRYVYLRDNFCCQYCGETFPPAELSLDHVIPRAKGGRLTWTNTVTACHSCNFKKASVSVEDLPRIGMRLRAMPYAPTLSEIQQKGRALKKSNYHPHWQDYL
jgi:5-methylcytosine-specific restriction endonuclease McrA